MSVFNDSVLYPCFLLTGFSGLESRYGLISLPIFLVYATSVAGNITILFIIRTEPSLHQPMYYFLSMLAFTDLGLSTTTLPTMFSVFWFHAREISFNGCLVQMYFIHVFSIIESAVLLAMAFDRLVAIRAPLRYAAILTNDVIIGIALAITGRALALVFPASFLLKRLQYRPVNILSWLLHPISLHPFCAILPAVDWIGVPKKVWPSLYPSYLWRWSYLEIGFFRCSYGSWGEIIYLNPITGLLIKERRGSFGIYRHR